MAGKKQSNGAYIRYLELTGNFINKHRNKAFCMCQEETIASDQSL